MFSETVHTWKQLCDIYAAGHAMEGFVITTLGKSIDDQSIGVEYLLR